MSHATPHRLLYFFVAFVLLMFFGLIYAWSLFVDPLEAEFGWDRSATQCVHALHHHLLRRHARGGRAGRAHVPAHGHAHHGRLPGTGTYRFGLHRIAALHLRHLRRAGRAGVGLGTDVVMSVTLKWFPDKQGLASGAMLMGFGGGTMLLSPVVTTMLGALGWRLTFGALGVIFVVLVGAGAFIMKLPTPEYVRPLLERRGRTPPWRPST